jgi:hypothetical protein
MERLAEKTITEALAKAMEQADRMKHVVVICETIESDNSSHVIIATEQTSIAQINFMADIVKEWCLSK